MIKEKEHGFINVKSPCGKLETSVRDDELIEWLTTYVGNQEITTGYLITKKNCKLSD